MNSYGTWLRSIKLQAGDERSRSNARVAYRTSNGYAEAKLHLKIIGQNILSRHADEMYSVSQDSVNRQDTLPLTEMPIQLHLKLYYVGERLYIVTQTRHTQLVISCSQFSFLPVDIIPCSVVSTMSQNLRCLHHHSTDTWRPPPFIQTLRTPWPNLRHRSEINREGPSQITNFFSHVY
jgi:hypothetical protein